MSYRFYIISFFILAMIACQSKSLLNAQQFSEESFSKSKLSILNEMILRSGIQATKALNYLMDGTVSREKFGRKISFSLIEDPLLIKFHSFDHTPKPPPDNNPLNLEQIEKLTKLMSHESITEKDHWQALLNKATHKYATGLDLVDEEWIILGKVNLALTQDYFKTLHSLFNTKLLNSHQEKMSIFFGVDYKEALIAEVLAKTLAYAANLGGNAIDLPVKNDNGSYHLVSYLIKEFKIGDNLICYVLETKDVHAKPWFIARGTNFQGNGTHGISLESLLADTIDDNGLAEDIIIKAMFSKSYFKVEEDSELKISLLELLEKWHSEGKCPILCGHSLGGYIVTDIAVRLNSLITQAYAFNAPGVGEALEQRWNVIVQKDQTRYKKIISFSTEGDVIPSVGRKLIAKHIAISHDTKSALSPIHKHLRMSLNKNFEAQEIDTPRENRKVSRWIAESVRQGLGKLFKGYIMLFNEEHLPDWWSNRHIYRQALLEYEKEKSTK